MKKRINILLVSLFLAAPGTLFSFTFSDSTWSLIKSITVPQIKKVSIDRYSNLFIADNHGNVFKYDSLGNEVLKYSPSKKSEVTLLEAWRTVNVFVFYRELQEYNLLDRFLTAPADNLKIKNEIGNENSIGFARIATVAPDNNLWIFDDDDFSLKKYDTRLNKVIFNTSLDLILDPQFYDLNYIREYQNLLFINDRNSGILVFDNLGNYKKKLPYKGVEYFNFLGNNMYFLSGTNLIITDIYSGIEKSVSLPGDKSYLYALAGPGTIYLFTKDRMDLYTLKFPEAKE